MKYILHFYTSNDGDATIEITATDWDTAELLGGSMASGTVRFSYAEEVSE
jgi:hypothetical protein